jgi:predicted RNA-binding Zn-ribbon protein involved in translation (DUF1610 family)
MGRTNVACPVCGGEAFVTIPSGRKVSSIYEDRSKLAATNAPEVVRAQGKCDDCGNKFYYNHRNDI